MKDEIATAQTDEHPIRPGERRILFMEPFFGGSHRDFAEGLIAASRHRIDLVSLPDRFWKWRMRGAALHWAKTIAASAPYDAWIATDLVSLAELKGIVGHPPTPSLLYFHENQLSYPLPPGEALDVQFGFTNIASALAAELVVFNSRYQMTAFFHTLPAFLRRMPDHRPGWVMDAIRAKARVIYPGCRFPAGPAPKTASMVGEGPPLILWNHRWEFDKNPELFFRVLGRMEERGLSFRLALLGERYRRIPACFVDARRRFGHRIVVDHFEEDRGRYRQWLQRGDVVISTSDQENFGMSMVEAMRRGCIPILPRRLSYPEVLPTRYHEHFLYDTEEQLTERLSFCLSRLEAAKRLADGLTDAMETFAWDKRIDAFDNALESLIDPSHAIIPGKGDPSEG
jgi:glycosyltransferase involved in cell wall biosynthesis